MRSEAARVARYRLMRFPLVESIPRMNTHQSVALGSECSVPIVGLAGASRLIAAPADANRQAQLGGMSYSIVWVKLVGTPAPYDRFSEVLNRKRPLSLRMVKRLHDGLKIPYESLLAELPRRADPGEGVLGLLALAFLSLSRGVAQCLQDVLALKVWVVGQELIDAAPRSDLANDHARR